MIKPNKAFRWWQIGTEKLASSPSAWDEFAELLRGENEKLRGDVGDMSQERHPPSSSERLQVTKPEHEEVNQEAAIAALRAGFESIRSPLGESCLLLARDHLARYPDQGDVPRLREAERLSRVAALLRPDDKVATTLMVEIHEAMIARQIKLDHHESAVSSLSDSSSILRTDGASADPLVRLLVERAQEHFAMGQFLIQEQIANRASQVGIGNLGRAAPATLGARYQHMLAQNSLGRYREAFLQVTDLLPDQERVLGAEHHDTLTTRYRRAEILDNLGEYENARQAVELLIPIQERVLGVEHADTLTTRFRRATILNRLGEHEAARQAVELLIPIQERVLGIEHPDTLTTRYRRAEILDDLGESENARQAVEHLIPIQERVLGAEHPDTLTTHFRRAKLLDDLGEYEDARQAVDRLIPIQERVLGVEHTDTLTTRFRRATILNSLGEHDAAREAMEQLLAVRETQQDTLTQRYLKAIMIFNDMGRHRTAHKSEDDRLSSHQRLKGPLSPNTLVMRCRKAEIMVNHGKLEEARAELAQILPVQERSAGPEHPDTLATRGLKVRILAELGERYSALMEIDTLLPVQERVLGMHHRLTEATRRFKAELAEKI